MQAKFFTDDKEILKHGFFQVRDFITLSKFEAWQYAAKNNIEVAEIKLNFNDEHLSRFDWQKEPAESITDLYIKRAKELREKYDYLVLLFSGGIDSYTILHTFLDNDIKIDEIITCCNLDHLPKDGLFNQEVFKAALPHIESLNLEKRGILHRVVEIGNLIQNQYSHDWHLQNSLYMVNGIICNWSYFLRSGLLKMEQHHQMFLSGHGKSIGYVWGLDKPNIQVKDNKFYYQYVDQVPDFALKKFAVDFYDPLLKNFHDEAFFVSNDNPEIVIKQSHMLVKELNNTVEDDPRLGYVYHIPTSGPYVQFNQHEDTLQSKWLKKKEVEKIIYPNAPHDMFGDDKIRGSTMYTKRDAWFFRSKHENRNKLVEYWKRNIREHEPYFKYTIEGTPSNSITIFGKPYYIGQKHT